MSEIKRYTEEQLRALGMDDAQIKAILDTYAREDAEKENREEEKLTPQTPVAQFPAQVVHVEHTVQTAATTPLKVTTLKDLESYKQGVLVELPPFADGQPFVARLKRPSMLKMVKNGTIPNELINQATSLFANGTGALNQGGKGSTNVSELFDVIDTIVDAALMEPTIADIESVGMELSDDQLMAIFSYTQTGVKALSQFRTK